MPIIDLEHSNFNVPIPRIFHSFEKDGMFTHCTACNSYLLEDGNSYFIEKAVKGKEVIFEYAMCANCRDTMTDEISFESMMALGEYFLSNTNMEERQNELMNSFDNSIKDWVSKCLFTQQPRNECESYQLCAECEGKNLIVSFSPFMISSSAAEEIQQLISKETRKSFDKFTREVLNLPTDFKDIPILI